MGLQNSVSYLISFYLFSSSPCFLFFFASSILLFFEHLNISYRIQCCFRAPHRPFQVVQQCHHIVVSWAHPQHHRVHPSVPLGHPHLLPAHDQRGHEDFRDGCDENAWYHAPWVSATAVISGIIFHLSLSIFFNNYLNLTSILGLLVQRSFVGHRINSGSNLRCFCGEPV